MCILIHERWGGWITIPIYSAELHPQNKSKIVKKVSLKLEKLDIIKNTESVGIEVTKSRDE